MTPAEDRCNGGGLFTPEACRGCEDCLPAPVHPPTPVTEDDRQ